jgi:hypothetical protein
MGRHGMEVYLERDEVNLAKQRSLIEKEYESVLVLMKRYYHIVEM